MTEFQSHAATLLTLENERLRSELRRRLKELDSCRRRAVDTAEVTRGRIERDLHDGLQQRLVSIAMALGLLDAKLPAEPQAAKPIAREARNALAAALDELRELSQGIYPSVLAERGLSVALEELCERSPVRCELAISLEQPPSAPAAAATYFAVSETLTNVAKHANASTVRVVARCVEGELTVEVHDDGIGGATTAGGSGLQGLTDRVSAIGGRLSITSGIGHGTTVRAEIPSGCEAHELTRPAPVPARPKAGTRQ